MASQSSSALRPGSGGWVLVVAGDDANRHAVIETLRSAGFETSEAGTGADAVRRASDDPDAVVIGSDLPDMSGADLARHLRAQPRTPTVPIVHVAALREPSHHMGEVDDDATVYLDPAVEPAVLVATLRALLRVRSAEQRLTESMDAQHRALKEAERARRAAEKASRAKSEFLTTMSHELRTPINAMLGYAQLIDMGISGAVSPEQREHLDRLRRSGAHLLTLVDEVLDLARVDDGRLRVEREATAVHDVVQDALAVARQLAMARGMTIEPISVPAQLSYVGDRGRVRQILINLLSNAVRFSPAGSSIAIEAESGTPPVSSAIETGDGQYVAIHVVDRGVGIASERIESMFEPFVQAERGHRRSRDGTGLGLAISRRLARLMHGDVTVKSKAGEGSRFTLWLPVPAEDAMAATVEVPAPAISRARRVDPELFSQIGRDIAGAAFEISSAVAVRLRQEPDGAPVGTLGDAHLMDHTTALVADLGQSLVIVGEVGPELSELLRDGNAIRHEIACRHGEQRARLGWTIADVEREYAILREEISRVVTRRSVDDRRVEGALELLQGLIAQAVASSVRAFRAPRSVSS
jgi:signal transduction histidine kinase